VLVALNNRSRTRVEFDGEIVRLVKETGVDWMRPTVLTIAASSLLDVLLREPVDRIGQSGLLHFVTPGGAARPKGWSPKIEDGTIFFTEAERADFLAVYEAVAEPWLAARRIGANMSRFLVPQTEVPRTTPAIPDTEVHEGLRIGEINSQFDSRMAGQITGKLRHELGFHGGSVGVGVGGYSLSVGRLGLSGVSSVDLGTEGTSRADLLNQAFVAVFEVPTQRGIPETLRVVVPSEAACSQMLIDSVLEIAGRMGSEPLPDTEITRMTGVLGSLVSTEITYALDRLNAVLRIDRSARPAIDVVGIPIGPGALLGGALRIQGESRWVQLFPLGLMHAMRDPDEAARLVQDSVKEELELAAGEPTGDGPSASTVRAGHPPSHSTQSSVAVPAMKTCPMCAEDVRAAARICRFCRYEFPPD
jgi:hypothetical protein